MMVNVTYQIKFNDLPDLIRQSPAAASKAIRAAALEGRNIAVESIREPSPGHPQARSNPDRVVMASNPGEPPNADLGNLMNSIDVVQGAGNYEQYITVGAEYGYTLEFGLPDGSVRPFMYPMMLELKPRLPEFFRAAFDGIL